MLLTAVRSTLTRINDKTCRASAPFLHASLVFSGPAPSSVTRCRVILLPERSQVSPFGNKKKTPKKPLHLIPAVHSLPGVGVKVKRRREREVIGEMRRKNPETLITLFDRVY